MGVSFHILLSSKPGGQGRRTPGAVRGREAHSSGVPASPMFLRPHPNFHSVLQPWQLAQEQPPPQPLPPGPWCHLSLVTREEDWLSAVGSAPGMEVASERPLLTGWGSERALGGWERTRGTGDQPLCHSPPGEPLPESAGQEEKQSPQHSMQISRQSADSQQASRMPQSRSQGRSQSAHSPEPQQQQQRHESSELQEPHVAQSRTMLHSVRNSQKRQDRMQWTQQSAGGESQVRQPAAGDLARRGRCPPRARCSAGIKLMQPWAAPPSADCEEPRLIGDGRQRHRVAHAYLICCRAEVRAQAVLIPSPCS